MRRATRRRAVLPQHDPIYKATIIPRGRALGLVMCLPERDRLLAPMTSTKSMIAMAMGGKVAEEHQFGAENVPSPRPSGDIQQVSRIARAMVTRSACRRRRQHRLCRRAVQLSRAAPGGVSDAGPDTKRLIEQEVKRLIDEGYETAKRILIEKRDDLDRLAKGLLEYETLTGDEIRKVIDGEPLGGDDTPDAPPSGGGSASVTAIPKTKTRAKKPGSEPEPAPL